VTNQASLIPRKRGRGVASTRIAVPAKAGPIPRRTAPNQRRSLVVASIRTLTAKREVIMVPKRAILATKKATRTRTRRKRARRQTRSQPARGKKRYRLGSISPQPVAIVGSMKILMILTF